MREATLGIRTSLATSIAGLLSSERSPPQTGQGGCLKVLAIGLPILLLMGLLGWKVAQSGGHAEAVAERVTTPYLEQIRQGHYQEALDRYGSDEHRARVSAAALEAAYDRLIRGHGHIVGVRFVGAQEVHQVGGESFVQARYTIHQTHEDSLVTYDIVGEGDAAKIRQSFERRPEVHMLVPAPR